VTFCPCWKVPLEYWWLAIAPSQVVSPEIMGFFRDLLGPLREQGLPIHIALGNHDNRERFWEVLTQETLGYAPRWLTAKPRCFAYENSELVYPGFPGRNQLNTGAAGESPT
jgi:hypothetical protein